MTLNTTVVWRRSSGKESSRQQFLSSIARLNCTCEGKRQDKTLQSFVILCSQRWWKESQWLMFNRYPWVVGILHVWGERTKKTIEIISFYMKKIKKIVYDFSIHTSQLYNYESLVFFSPLLYRTGWLQLRWGCKKRFTSLHNLLHFRVSV